MLLLANAPGSTKDIDIFWLDEDGLQRAYAPLRESVQVITQKHSEPTFWERRLTMEFETLRLMAQDYADRHKEPPPLPPTIDTVAYAYQRMCQGEDPWTALGDFSNAWYGYAKHIRPDLVRDPLIKPEQETEYTQSWGAFCAASVEYLCGLHHQPCPEWVHDSFYILDTPWWYTQRADDPTIREHTRSTTPPPFARRNIFCSNRLYQNKYEMYEWIQEAIVKGVTDVHEIQRYARQKEINLYGA